MAYVASCNGHSVAYLDCDVEEPNGHIFLKPEITKSEPVGSLAPQVNEEICTQCGQCGEICQFSAIACIGRHVLTFPELCHACGGCSRVCSAGAITEVTRETGRVEVGRCGSMWFIQGLLNVGEAMSPPVIRAVKAAAPRGGLVFVDAPPGTSCPVIEAVKGSDRVVLVTEPTPFGLHDLELAVEMVRALHLPFYVVINRSDVGDREVSHYCRRQGIKVLAEIPHDRRVAEAYSRGELICARSDNYRSLFVSMLREISGVTARPRSGATSGILEKIGDE
jgi:MinD superfamily P-loop ATPase